MNMKGQPTSPSGFPPGYRASGLLLHVTSLPSRYGIGDVGPEALAWVDRLHEAEQSWWQALPLGPTGYGDSPYQPLSSFAGNWLLLSPDGLVAEGLLQPGEAACASFPETTVDYDAVAECKHRLLETTWSHFGARASRDLKIAFDQFRTEQAHWLEDYALFRALKSKYPGVSYLDWPAELVQRHPAALAAARQELASQIDQVRMAQFLLFRQGETLKEHAHSRNVRLIGDLPFFVSGESSDVWANPEYFLLDERRRPRFVGGVPPDFFSPQGQLWGNPVYDWKALREAGYRWCIDRVRALLAHVDMIRLDHFRGFAAAWHVPAGAPTAQSGEWVPGPGAEYFAAMQREFGSLPFIAEDLGFITPDVIALRDQFHVPGTRVLQFAFDGGPDNPHLPANYVPIPLSTRGLMTTIRRGAGTKGFPMIGDRSSGGTWKSPMLKVPQLPRHVEAGVVLRGGAGTGPAPGSTQLGHGGPHERAGQRQRQLALALDEGDAFPRIGVR